MLLDMALHESTSQLFFLKKSSNTEAGIILRMYITLFIICSLFGFSFTISGSFAIIWQAPLLETKQLREFPSRTAIRSSNTVQKSKEAPVTGGSGVLG